MFTIENSHDGKFDIVIMKDTTSGTVATLTPARGGMLTSLVSGDKEYMYINKDNFYDETIPPERPRCASPILFPSLGLCENEVFIDGDKEYPMPIHGLVQHQAWKVVDTNTDDGANVTLEVTSDEESLKSFPYEYKVQITYVLKGNTVTLKQSYKNMGEGKMPFGFGFHPYFKVSDMRDLTINVNAGSMAHDPNGPFENIPENIILPYEQTGNSYTLFKDASKSASFTDPADGRKLTVTFDDNFPYMIFWCVCANGFVCVEPWNTLPNTINTNPANILSKGEVKTAEIAYICE